MTVLTRKKLGYALSTLNAPVLLAQDIDELDAQWHLKEKAIDYLLAASDELEMEAKQLGIQEMTAQILLLRGQILLSYKQYHDALKAFIEADQIIGPIRQQDLKVKIYASLAETHAKLKSWPAVLNVCQTGIDLVEQYRYEVSGQYLRSSYLRSRIGLYRHGIRAAYELGEVDLMLEWTELSKCRSVLRQSNLLTAETGEITKTEKQFHQLCRQIDEARAAGNETDLDNLLLKRRIIWDLLLIQRGQSQPPKFPEFQLRTIQTKLAPDEAVLNYYWLDDQTLLIMAIDNSQQKTILCTLTAETRQELETFATIILESLSPKRPRFYDYVDKVRAFAATLLPEQLFDVIKDKKRLLISPHQLLHAIPFQALPWDDEHRYLIQRFALTYIPNLSTLLLPYQEPSENSLLAFGICDYSHHGPTYETLEEAEQEVVELKSLYKNQGFNVQTLLNEEVNQARLRQLEQKNQLAEYSCIHISTHGQNVNSDNPMESYLLLYDSVLDGLEIANWRLNAGLIVLSACSAGQRPFRGRGMDEIPGDDIFGLQAAFFTAGAKRVLSSLWPVDPTDAYKIVVSFHHSLVNGLSPELALQRAIVNFIDSAGVRKRKSYYWASFFLSAVGRPV